MFLASKVATKEEVQAALKWIQDNMDDYKSLKSLIEFEAGQELLHDARQTLEDEKAAERREAVDQAADTSQLSSSRNTIY